MATTADPFVRNTLPPVATAALLHGLLWAGLLALALLLPAAAAATTPWQWIEGSLAAALGWILRLPLWWIPINVAFFPLLLAAVNLDPAPGLVLGVFAVLYS